MHVGVVTGEIQCVLSACCRCGAHLLTKQSILTARAVVGDSAVAAVLTVPAVIDTMSYTKTLSCRCL